MLLSKIITFDAAHSLPFHEGQCKQLHGHTWKAIITIDCVVNKNMMGLDFREFSNVLKEHVVSKLDHHYLNEFITLPTAENLSIWIWKALQGFLPMHSVQLFESETSFVTLDKESFYEYGMRGEHSWV